MVRHLLSRIPPFSWFFREEENLEEDEEILYQIDTIIKTKLIPMVNNYERTHAINSLNEIRLVAKRITNKSVRKELEQLIIIVNDISF